MPYPAAYRAGSCILTQNNRYGVCPSVSSDTDPSGTWKACLYWRGWHVMSPSGKFTRWTAPIWGALICACIENAWAPVGGSIRKSKGMRPEVGEVREDG